jgi:NitT/TauT family transport system permease protein
MKKFINIYAFIPLLLIIGIWELFSYNSPRNTFLFSSPSKILQTFVAKITNGELINHTLITGYEALLGLVLGVTIGSIIGFLLLYFPIASKISKYYVIALSSIPVFALAPMMIIWFGTGLEMKIALAFFSTVFVAIFQAYQGGQNVSKQELDFFVLNKASKKQRFWNLTFPSSIDWLIQSLKINSGLSILGAFIGEFIASNKGLGYFILKASGLYDVSSVLAGTIAIILLTLLFNFLAGLIERNKLKIIREITV